jgi:hypothetical protein
MREQLKKIALDMWLWALDKTQKYLQQAPTADLGLGALLHLSLHVAMLFGPF